MATPSTVQRAAEVGDSFRTFTTAGVRTQGASLVDEAGNHQGVTGNPLRVENTAETFVRYSSPATGEDSKADVGTGPCEVRQFRVLLDPAVTADRYLMFFNSLTVPVDTTVPDWRMLVQIKGEASETFLKGEMAFAIGLSVALSSTVDSLTVTLATEAFFQAVTV